MWPAARPWTRAQGEPRAARIRLRECISQAWGLDFRVYRVYRADYFRVYRVDCFTGFIGFRLVRVQGSGFRVWDGGVICHGIVTQAYVSVYNI